MQTISKTKTAAIFALIFLIASLSLPSIPIQAQLPEQEGGSIPGPIPSGVTPDLLVDTIAFLSFRPTTVGVGQTFLVNMWLNPATHASRYFKDYEVTITKPDGTEDVITMDSFRADTTAYFEYVADQAGEWTLKFDFPGGLFPAGIYTPAPGAVFGTNPYTAERSVYYKPSSTQEQTLTVQDEMVYSWPPAPLPTDYWERPGSLENREWWPILGNYPGTGYSPGESIAQDMWDELYPDTNPCWSSQYAFHPWVTGPNTAHIAWKDKQAIAGLIGGPAGQLGQTTGGFGGGMPNPSLILEGRAYDSYDKPGTDETYMRCYDIRTGEIFFERPAISTTFMWFGIFEMTTVILPTTIAYTTSAFLEVPGASAGRTYDVELLRIEGDRLYKWDPWTGEMTVNASLGPLTGTFHNQMEGYVLGVVGGRLINWTTAGSTDNWESRIITNTTYASNSLPARIDWESGYGGSISSITPDSLGAWYGSIARGYNLYTGEMLWEKEIPDTLYSSSCTVADHGKIAGVMMGGYFMAWDLRTGSLAWKGEAMDYPWSEPAFGAYSIQSAYGMLYRQAYDGVYAFNWDDGSIAWKYKAPAKTAYETPYIDETGAGVYSFNTGATIADGKMYTYNTEHTESWPLTRGWGIHCINITDGTLVWKIGNPMSPGAIADGYLAAADFRNGYQYIFGKGKSATTVHLAPKIITQGEEVVIEGSVLDMSPAQPGTPCVSSESMTLQMEYLHLQQPLHGLWGNESVAGVTVSIVTVDPNNNYRHIGEVNTDGYTGTFGFTWKPDVPGQYRITAQFLGDDSYGSSMATTYLEVVEPEPTITPEPTPAPIDYMPMLYAILAVGIIAIILALLALLWKR